MNVVIKDGDVIIGGKSFTPREAILIAMEHPRGSLVSRGLTLAATMAQAQRDEMLSIAAAAGDRMAREERSKLN